MKRIVVDSIVCVNWLIQTGGKRTHTFALDLLEHVRRKELHLVQPAFWRTHVSSLVLHRRSLDMRQIAKTLLAVESRDQSDAHVLTLAIDIALSMRVELFDAIYHAVAIEKGIDLITANTDYVERASQLGHVRLLSEWAARARIAEEEDTEANKPRFATPHARPKKH